MASERVIDILGGLFSFSGCLGLLICAWREHRKKQKRSVPHGD